VRLMTTTSSALSLSRHTFISSKSFFTLTLEVDFNFFFDLLGTVDFRGMASISFALLGFFY
jgi:hypothetical protein